MTFGERIRELRVEKGMAQRDLAKSVDIDFTYLSKIENGKVPPPSDEVIHKLANRLEVNAEELLSLAAKVDAKELREAVAQNPRVGVLFRKLQSRKLTKDQVDKMLKIVAGDEEAP